LEDTKQIADLLYFNLDKLTLTQLAALAKGVKTHSTLNIEHSECKVDATQTQINLGKFCYNLLTQEIAGVIQWNKTSDIKHHIEQATNKLNTYRKQTIAINPCFLPPGNCARILFTQKNAPHILHPLQSEVKKPNFSNLLLSVRFMNKLFSSRKPKEEFPDEWYLYKSRVIELGCQLTLYYSYARWSSYVFMWFWYGGDTCNVWLRSF